MRAVALSIILMPAIAPAAMVPAPAFIKASSHFYYLEFAPGTPNTGAVVTSEGVLLIDPPPDAETPALLSALKALTSRPVRWVVMTDYQRARAGGAATFVKQGAALICSKELNRLATAASAPGLDPALPPAPDASDPRFVFGGQLHLFPAGIEIRIIAIRHRARTAGDVIVFVPSEKVLQVGDLFNPATYPIIDNGPGEGSAPGWIDGLKQAVESVPLLKSAMPQPKPEPTAPPEPELTVEETVTVIPAYGAPANLQQMKSLLAVVVKLRAEATRAVAAGRDREDFVRLLAADPYGTYGNLEAFAGQLFDDLLRK